MLLCLLLFFTLPIGVNGTTTGIVNVNDSLTLRDKPSTSGNVITKFYNNTELNIIDTNSGSGNGCLNNWYKVKYITSSKTYEGYSCGDYINIKKEEKSNYDGIDNSYDRNNYNNKSNSDGSIMCYEDVGSINLRKSANSSVRNNIYVNCGDNVSILEIVDTPLNRCPYWYNIKTNKGSGYLCGYFVNTTKLSNVANKYYNNKTNGDTIDSYTNKLKNLGFNDSYIPYLLELHARHANWNFIPETISLDFDSVVDGENVDGRNLLEYNAFNPGYLSIDRHTYNVFNNTFTVYDGEPGYYNASREAIAYYLDPRNYLNEKYIFAFETLNYSSNQNNDMVNSIIKNQGFWSSLYGNGSVGASNDIVNSSKQINISAIHVATRIKQEVTGVGTSDSRIGGKFTYDGVSKSGYYNFFNIKSWSGRGSSIYSTYAYENGWNTPKKGIYGGAKFLYNDYISLNQDTLYYEKFDVSRNSGKYTHQYMQNLAVVAQEAGIKYDGYINGNKNYLNTAITFVIPVYNNMPKYVVTAPKLGNSNNFLKNITIDNTPINSFSYDTYNYNIYLKSDVKNVNIEATRMVNSSSISGIGKINIDSNDQINSIKVTAENGKLRVYNLHFIREVINNTSNNNNNTNNNSSSSNNSEIIKKVTVSEVMNNSGYKYNDKYIFGIDIGTNVDRFVSNISSYNKYSTVSIKSSNNVIKSNDSFRTGDKVLIKTSDGDSKEYTAIIFGDIDGNGVIDKKDLLYIQSKAFGYISFDNVKNMAGDINKDGKVDKTDLLYIQSHVFGYSKIKQG